MTDRRTLSHRDAWTHLKTQKKEKKSRKHLRSFLTKNQREFRGLLLMLRNVIMANLQHMLYQSCPNNCNLLVPQNVDVFIGNILMRWRYLLVTWAKRGLFCLFSAFPPFWAAVPKGMISCRIHKYWKSVRVSICLSIYQFVTPSPLILPITVGLWKDKQIHCRTFSL